jgi:hypothetical protein
MVRKKMEGDEEQRRAAARAAREAGSTPSADKVTTGASKQRSHLSHRDSVTHDERLASRHRGKQRAGDTGEARGRAPDREPAVSFTGRGRPGYSSEHERVLGALVRSMERHGGDAVHLEEVARTADMPRDEVRPLMHDLVTTHKVATELAGVDRPDLGPRYGLKPGR